MTIHLARRGFLAAGFAAASVFASARKPLVAQMPNGPFSLPALPYAANANEAAIDVVTMELHHGRHHAAAVAALNNIAHDYPALTTMQIDDALMRLSQAPDAVRTALRNNVGSHANHSMFWEIMGGQGGEPGGDLKAAIDRDLGGFAKMQTDFNAAGMRVFGSGWVFVVVTPAGGLSIVTRPNQDTPLMDGQRVLMGNDVWEHAYYLRYQNRRAEYLTNWWKVLNWDRIAARYDAARNGTLRM
ncbi:MAG: superoxide dismutase [Alphaproteobacteria bacterium]|nr:superoxide dismutase [Alphaproteobacteria bacterium]